MNLRLFYRLKISISHRDLKLGRQPNMHYLTHLRWGKVSIAFCFFFFNDTATTEISTLSLHDALPISAPSAPPTPAAQPWSTPSKEPIKAAAWPAPRSEEHTSELQSHLNLVCRLLLEKKKKKTKHCLRDKKKKTYKLT